MCENCNCGYVIAISQTLSKLLCAIEGMGTVNPEDVATLKRMQAHLNPMTVAGEYPSVTGNRFVVSTPVRFLDMLNTDLYVIFKIDNNSYELPVYFKDAVGYEHQVVLGDATPVLVNQLQLNGIYKAKYQYTGGYIILDSLIPINPDTIDVE